MGTLTYNHEQFRTFLSRFADDEVVGTVTASVNDPMTRFLREVTGNPDVWYCGLFTLHLDEQNKAKSEETPDWAAAFGFFLRDRKEATGEVCRQVLATVTRGSMR